MEFLSQKNATLNEKTIFVNRKKGLNSYKEYKYC